MDIRPIRNDADLSAALQEIDRLWKSEPGTPEGDKMEVLVTLVEAYENKHYPIPDADPIEVLTFMMEQNGRTQTDLAKLFGSRSRASEVLSRRRPLSKDMIYKLSTEWHIPADALIGPYPLKEVA